MKILILLLLIIATVIDILMIGILIASAIKYFKDKKYFHFGVDVAVAITAIAMLIKVVVF
jgi:hypothetical protein